MIYGSFVDVEAIAEEAGCDEAAVYLVADRVLEALHKSILINGVTGSLHEAIMRLSTEAAYHLGGIYEGVADTQIALETTQMYVNDIFSRMGLWEECAPAMERMEAWEETLNEDQKGVLECSRMRYS